MWSATPMTATATSVTGGKFKRLRLEGELNAKKIWNMCLPSSAWKPHRRRWHDDQPQALAPPQFEA
jgi:hypothetical protein